MMPASSAVPILIIAYRRPDLLVGLLQAIPDDRRLYIVVDGPKSPDHLDGVIETRSLVTAWAQSRRGVKLCLRDHNMGGPDGIPSAIDFAFTHEKILCILEEDCIPSPLAFSYVDYASAELEASSSIAGGTLNNFVAARLGTRFPSSFLSLFPHCWGWYTTKEAWSSLRPSRDEFRSFSSGEVSCVDSVLLQVFPNDRRARHYWRPIFKKLIACESYHWDYAFTFKMWSQGKKFIAPPVNLVSNVGADDRSQNCKTAGPNHFLKTPVGSRPADIAHLLQPVSRCYDYEDFDRINQALVFPSKLSLRAMVRKSLLLAKQFRMPKPSASSPG